MESKPSAPSAPSTPRSSVFQTRNNPIFLKRRKTRQPGRHFVESSSSSQCEFIYIFIYLYILHFHPYWAKRMKLVQAQSAATSGQQRAPPAGEPAPATGATGHCHWRQRHRALEAEAPGTGGGGTGHWRWRHRGLAVEAAVAGEGAPVPVPPSGPGLLPLYGYLTGDS